jgi:superfamily I DNA/RNA helicase
LISEGIPASIQGRDIGGGLIDWIEGFKAQTMNELLGLASDWFAREREKALKAADLSILERAEDKYHCLLAISSRARDPDELRRIVSSLFDNSRGEGEMGNRSPAGKVVLGTIHKTKGLEADRVLVAAPHMIPSVHAKTPTEKQQERNLAYVAATRSKDSLSFLGRRPGIYG